MKQRKYLNMAKMPQKRGKARGGREHGKISDEPNKDDNNHGKQSLAHDRPSSRLNEHIHRSLHHSPRK